MVCIWAFWPFSRSVSEAVVRAEEEEIPRCGQCLRCLAACPTGALEYHDGVWRIDLAHCIFCRSCAAVCPNHLISPFDQ